MVEKPLIPVNDQIAFVLITKKDFSGSRWIKEGNKQTYERKNAPGFDELIITKTSETKITYILDSRSKLSYEISNNIVDVEGHVYDRQEHSK